MGYRQCPGESVITLTVTDQTASQPATLWTVRRAGETGRVVLGERPLLFDLLSALIPPDESHVIRFELEGPSEVSATVEFVPAQLARGQYWDAGAAEPSPSSQLERTGSS